MQLPDNATPYLCVNGDNLDILKTIPDNTFDAIVTDPPYGLSTPPDAEEMLQAWLTTGHYDVTGKGFMGKEWDAFVPQPLFWKEAFRVLKPGGHLLSFAGTRTFDLMGLSIRLAGFEIRDTIRYLQSTHSPCWSYASGFPKSLNVGKAIDEKMGLTREVVGQREDILQKQAADIRRGQRKIVESMQAGAPERNNGFVTVNADITAPASEEAKQWEGWGSQLKPAWEPIVVARKPLEGTLVDNVINHGVGALNIDACRVSTTDNLNGGAYAQNGQERHDGAENWRYKREGGAGEYQQPRGRFPANLIHDGSPDVVAEFPSNVGGDKRGECQGRRDGGFADVGADSGDGEPNARVYDDSGSISRFYYCAKASATDRNEGCEDLDANFTSQEYGFKTSVDDREGRAQGTRTNSPRANFHPTVKPTPLMQYLCRLVTPPNGLILDPFMGSGSTGKAAMLEGFRFVGIEREADYHKIAEKRIVYALKIYQEQSKFEDCDMFE